MIHVHTRLTAVSQRLGAVELLDGFPFQLTDVRGLFCHSLSLFSARRPPRGRKAPVWLERIRYQVIHSTRLITPAQMAASDAL